MSLESDAGYLKGRADFLGLSLHVAPGVLVPRRETELLALSAIARLADLPSPRAVDVCCGAGNLACGIAARIPAARVWASDLTDACVTLARRNVTELGLAERVTVLQGDLLSPVSLLGPFDLIVCNPPYISTGKLADRADLSDEPREAFDGGPYGLSIHQRVLKEALPLLSPGGHLLFEFGLGQGRQLELLFQRARGYDSMELIRDEGGEPRVAAARRSK